jgi:GT2 family glycosyltransferase
VSADNEQLGLVLAPEPAEPVAPLDRPPAFSIVIPTYQAAETVADSIESALSQEHPAQEVIVVDDGSTDDLDPALQPFMGRIELVRKENGGGASALNAGAEAASGEFMAILDADDAYDPRRLAALAGLACARPDLDLITTDARFLVGGREVGSFLAENPFATDDQRQAIFESCFVGGWPAIRRKRLQEIGGFDESLRTGYDWDCWIRLLLAGAKAGLVQGPYYEYRLHPDSLTGSRLSSLWDRVRLLEEAAGNPAVRDDERPALERAIRRHRSRAVMAEARAKADGAAPNARPGRRAFSRGVEPKARVAALLAACAPPLARRVLPADRPAEQRLAEGGR